MPLRARLSLCSYSCGVSSSAGHESAEHFFTGLSAWKDRRELSSVHHGNSIGQREDFGEIGGDEEDCLPRVARFAQLRVNELDGADVDAARGLRGEQDLKRAAHLTRDDDLLLVAS